MTRDLKRPLHRRPSVIAAVLGTLASAVGIWQGIYPMVREQIHYYDEVDQLNQQIKCLWHVVYKQPCN